MTLDRRRQLYPARKCLTCDDDVLLMASASTSVRPGGQVPRKAPKSPADWFLREEPRPTRSTFPVDAPALSELASELASDRWNNLAPTTIRLSLIHIHQEFSTDTIFP